MSQTTDTGSYRIELDGDWTLNDLYRFSNIYSQLYAFQYSFAREAVPDDYGEWTRDPYIANPWVGGYDAVNFYNQLASRVPHPHRPTLLSMHYASPGWIDLGVFLSVAWGIRTVVHAVLDDVERFNQVYSEVRKGMRERDLMKINVKRQELELARDKIQFIESCNEQLSELLKFRNRQEIKGLTSNPLTTLKILLSYCRRIKNLSKYETSRKTKI